MSQIRLGFCTLFAMVSGAAALRAGTETKLRLELKDLHHRAWTADDGLPNDRVFKITQSPQGYLWMSTEGGLVRFDGLRFALPMPAPAGTEDYLIADEPNGDIWVTRSKQKRVDLLHGRDGRLEAFTLPTAVADIVPLSLVRSRDGALWIGGYFGGVARIGKNGSVHRYTAAEGVPAAERVNAMLEDREGGIWLALAGSGVLHLRGGRFEPVGDKASALALAEDADGVIWVGTRNGAELIRAGRVEPFGQARQFGIVSAFLSDRSGAMWIGTGGKGIFRYRKGAIENFDELRGLTNNVVRSLFQDREGNVWVGTRSGLDRFSSALFTTLTNAEGLPSNSFGPILRDRSGSVWISPLTGGLFRLKGTVLEDLSTLIPHDKALAMAESSDGSIWLARQAGGLSRYRNGVVRTWTLAEGLAPAETDAVLEDKLGGLWIAQWGRGLYRMVKDRVEPVRGGGVPDCKFVEALAVTADNDVWVADGTAGLIRIRDGVGRLFDSRDGLAKGTATGVYVDNRGVVWALNSGTLSYLEEGKFHHIHFRGRSSMADVGEIHEDLEGGFWIAGSGGIYRASRRELDAVREGRETEAGLAQFSRIDGLLGTSGTKYSHPIMITGEHGSVWISSSRGLAVADPKKIQVAAPQVPVRIEQVESDDKALDANTAAQFAPGTRKLQFTFTGLNLSSPEKVMFRYRLAGLEGAWSQPTPARSAHYTNLPPGHYHFEAMAQNGGSPWSQSVASATIQVLPYYYQTIWFHAGWIAVLALLIWAAYLYRVRQIRERFELVLNERSRIAREIHDTLLQGFAGVAWQLDSVSRQIPANPRESQSQLNKLLVQLDECLAEARRAISGMRVSTAWQDGWEQQIEATGRQLTEGTEVKFSVKHRGASYELTPLGCESMFFVAKEAIHNSFRHAAAKSIRVSIDYRGKELCVEVRDDGHGFVAQQEFAPGHWGIQGMRERMGLAGGDFRIVSFAAGGTVVTATLPRVAAASRNGGQPKTNTVEARS